MYIYVNFDEHTAINYGLNLKHVQYEGHMRIACMFIVGKLDYNYLKLPMRVSLYIGTVYGETTDNSDFKLHVKVSYDEHFTSQPISFLSLKIQTIRVFLKLNKSENIFGLLISSILSKDLREKGRDLTQSYEKSPYTHRKIQKATRQHKNATKNFDYTTIADRLRTVSWGNDSHPIGVIKPVYGVPNFPLTATVVLSKGYTFRNL